MNQLKEGEDYYLNENGLMVLTSTFHLKKGFCCGNACKHCPYDYINVKPPLTPPKEGNERSGKGE